MKKLIILFALLPLFVSGQYWADRTRHNPVVTDCAGYGFRGHWEPAAESYCEEALALFARMTTPPTETRKGEINTLITGMKTAGIWEKMDAVYVLAAADQQAALLNWIADTNNATAENSPTFTADSGFKSDGSTSWVNTHFNPYQDSVNFSRVDANVAVYCATSSAASDNFDIGCLENNGSQSCITLNVQDHANRINGVLWRASPNGAYVNVPSGVGLSSVSRDAVAIYVYKDGIFGTNYDPYAPTFTPNVEVGICCINYWNGGRAGYSTRRISFVAFGSLLSATEQAELATLVEAYMDAVGCGKP